MKLETFFEKFELVAEAPGGVAKLRELVLALAAQGRLLHQNADDEAAEILLASIEKDVASAVRARRMRAPKPTAPYEGALFDLPTGWQWSQLGRIVAAEDNAMCDGPFGSKLKTEHYVPTPGYAVVRLGNLGVGQFVWGKEGHISRERFESLSANHLVPGDLLVAGLADPLVRCCETPAELGPAVNKADCFRVRIHSLVDRTYVQHYLNSPIAKAFAGEENHGMTRERINLGNARALPIPIPPAAEQSRIVAKVDHLLAMCDRLEVRLQERETRRATLAQASLARFAEAPTPTNLNLLFHDSYAIEPADLRKSILTLAVQGRLVSQDPADDSVDRLLSLSLAERRRLRRTVSTETRLVDSADALGYCIPASWRWQTLDDLLVLGPTNGFSPKAVDHETAVRSLTLSATTSGQFKGEHSKFIATDVPPDSDLWLRDGDILVQRGNTIEYVGVAAVYRGQPNQFVYPDLMMKLRVASAFDTAFVHLAMSQDAARDFLRSRASGTSGSMPKINQATLKSLPLPIPPLAEQRRIVARVQQLITLVDKLEAQLSSSRALADLLVKAIVAEITSVS